MNEKRFRVRFEQEDGKGEIVNEKGVELTAREVVDLLNEQQATNDYLEESNSRLQIQLGETLRLVDEQQATIEILTKRRDRWRELSNSFSAYCNCYEKAIKRAFEEKPYPSEEDIYRIYAELEKELENE